jgi:hypothetical protein
MPFDGIGYEGRINTLDKMDKVIDLIGDERRWCKKVLQTLDGRRCILGAMTAANATIALREPILLAILQVTCRGDPRIEMFNDHPLTTHALVVKIPRQARLNVVIGRGATRGPDHRVRTWTHLCHVLHQGPSTSPGLVQMSPLRICAIALLMLGTANCALDGDNSSGTSVPQTASDAEGRLLEQQRQDTCLQHPEYCRR